MPRFQILHFPGPEMAGLSKKMNLKFGFFKKIHISSFSHLTIFFQHCFTKEKNLSNERMTKLRFFLKNLNFEFSFLDNPAISGPGKCKIWNLGIKMSKTPKYGF